MKISRNAPCPCGSGKKYKKCCLNKDKKPVDLLWRRLGDAHDRLVDDLAEYMQTSLDALTVPVAMDEFLLWPEEEEYEKTMAGHEQYFFPWLFFNWMYDPADPDYELDTPPDQTIAEMYAEKRGKRLDALQRRLIGATTRQPFSFYEVVSCDPGQGYRLRDIFTGTETDVLEKMGSGNTQPGSIMVARIVRVDHVTMVVGCGTMVIPPGMKPAIIDLRRMIASESNPITSGVLSNYDFEIRELYFDICRSLTNPPQLQNTDGDQLVETITPKAIEGVRYRLGLDRAPAKTEKRKTARRKKGVRTETIKSMIDGFGHATLDSIYTGFALKLCDRIAGMRKLDIRRGRVEIWAAAMIYVIARLNFLFDPGSNSRITPDLLCDYFGTKKSTVGNKATLIQQACRLNWGSEDYVHPDIADILSFVEAPDGFVLPKNLVNDPEFNLDNAGIEAKRFADTFSAALKQRQERDLETRRAQREERSRELAEERSKAKDEKDRQLKLFEDE